MGPSGPTKSYNTDIIKLVGPSGPTKSYNTDIIELVCSLDTLNAISGSAWTH